MEDNMRNLASNQQRVNEQKTNVNCRFYSKYSEKRENDIDGALEA